MAQDDPTGSSVDGDCISFMQNYISHLGSFRLEINLQGLTSTYTGLAHAPGHNGRMTGHAPSRSENAHCLHNAVNVVGSGFWANQNYFLTFATQSLGLIGIKDN